MRLRVSWEFCSEINIVCFGIKHDLMMDFVSGNKKQLKEIYFYN